MLTLFLEKDMKIAICDNERVHIDNIIRHLDFFSMDNKIDFEKYVFENPVDVLSSNVIFDIAILDVEMERMSGIELGGELRKTNPHIILMYVTAYRKYLDDALNLNAVRFFEKPLESQRFYRGLRDAINRIDNSSITFFMKDFKTVKRISAQDIIFVEIEGRKTKIVTESKEYHSDHSISFWKEKLKSTIFISPHKSYIINFNYVTEYQRDYIILDGKYRVSIARNKQTEFSKKFLRFAEGK